VPNFFFCHHWCLYYSPQEDGPSKDTSLGTQNSFHTLNRSFSTRQRCLVMSRDTLLMSKILKRFQLKSFRIN
jgi:hypothetical protein